MLEAKLRPKVPYTSNRTPWKCVCLKCKREVTPTYTQVRTRGTGCKYCTKHTVDPQEAKELFEKKKLRPLVKYPGAQTGWKSQCSICHSIVYPHYSNVRTGQNGCKYCAKKVGAAKKSKSKAQVYKFLRENGYYPLTSAEFISAKKFVLSKHKPCGSIVKARYFSIQQGRKCCKFCGTQQGALKWANTLEDIRPYLKNKKIILRDKKLKGMREKHKFKCQVCGLIWTTRLASLTSQSGCPNCADYGLKPNLPSYIYLIKHSKFVALKIGIANSNKVRDRLDKHQENGWVLINKKALKTGAKARKVELGCLNYLRIERNLPIHMLPKHMPQGGWTETVDARKIRASTIWAKVEELSRVNR
jgi:recombinational DNA repair protein (RecF pathway)